MTGSNPADSPIIVFISYSQDSEEHQDRVLALADRLRQDGFEVILDQYVAEPPQSWIAWMNKNLKVSKFILMIYTNSYAEKAEAGERSGSGWESILIESQMSFAPLGYAKYIPVFFDEPDLSLLPMSLQNASRYVLDRQYAELRGHLKGESRASRKQSQALQSRPPQTRTINFLRPWHVPFPRDPLFQGREDLLENIASAARGRQPIVIESNQWSLARGHDLAVEYAYRYKADYAGVFWLESSPEKLNPAYLAIARMLNLEEGRSASDGSSARSDFLGWLQTNRDWLLVLSGDPPGRLVAEFVPLAKYGTVVICAEPRRDGWPDPLQVISLAKAEEAPDDTPLPAAPVAPRRRIPRIFLSYRREARGVAERLVEELSQRGFLVAVDRFVLPPGADFQALLMSELGSADVIVVLESAAVAESVWLQLEVDFANRTRRGVVAITLPAGGRLPSIPPKDRILLTAAEFDASGAISPSALAKITDMVSRQHLLSTERQHQTYRSNVEAALLSQGLRGSEWDSEGILQVTPAPTSRAAIAVQPRTPTVQDIYRLYRNSPPATSLYLVSTPFLMLPEDRDELEWVARMAGVRLLDDGGLLHLAAEIAGNPQRNVAQGGLRNRFVLLSAGTLRESAGASDGVEELNVAIRSVIAALTKSVIGEAGRIVSAGHPNTLHVMTAAAAEALQSASRHPEDPPIHVYLSRVFEGLILSEDLQLCYQQGIAALHWTEAAAGDIAGPQQVPADSLRLLRGTMIVEAQPAAMVCIGGGDGVLEEFQMFRELLPAAPVFVLESTGGAAAAIAKQAPSGVRILDREFEQSLPAVSGERAYCVMMQALAAAIAAREE